MKRKKLAQKLLIVAVAATVAGSSVPATTFAAAVDQTQDQTTNPLQKTKEYIALELKDKSNTICYKVKRDTKDKTVDGEFTIKQLTTPLKVDHSYKLDKENQFREYRLNLKKKTKLTFRLATVKEKNGKSVSGYGKYQFRIFNDKSELLVEKKAERITQTIVLEKGNYQISVWGGPKGKNLKKAICPKMSIRQK